MSYDDSARRTDERVEHAKNSELAACSTGRSSTVECGGSIDRCWQWLARGRLSGSGCASRAFFPAVSSALSASSTTCNLSLP